MAPPDDYLDEPPYNEDPNTGSTYHPGQSEVMLKSYLSK